MPDTRGAWFASAQGRRALTVSAPTLVAHRGAITLDELVSTIDAAASAGFTGISVTSRHWDSAMAAGLTSEQYVEMHHERGIHISTVEVVPGWAGYDPHAVSRTGAVLDLAAVSGASTVIAAVLGPAPTDLGLHGRSLRIVCDLAAERGLRVSLEFLPWTVIPSLAAALAVADAADRTNLGLVLDSWHWFRQPGGPDPAALRAVPPERIHAVQLSDAPASPSASLHEEARTGRLLPGQGELDLPGLLRAIDATGATPAVISEVFNADLAARGPGAMAQLQFKALHALLSAYESSVCMPASQ